MAVVATRALVLPVARQNGAAGLLGLAGSADTSVPVLLAVAPARRRPALAGAAASALLSAVVVP